MKKLLLALVALTFLFSACNKEGVYSPKKKISTVYYQQTENDSKELLEIYFWNGNKLGSRVYNYTILDSYMYDIELVPTYQGNRVVRVDEKKSGDYVDYVYDGKFLSKLIYHSGNDYAEATVEHQDGKISKIFFNAAQTGSKACADNFISMFLSKKETRKMNEVIKKYSKSLSVVDMELLYTWDGNNVSHLVFNMYIDGEYAVTKTIDFKYDNMLNPFAVNWADMVVEDFAMMSSSGNIVTLSKHNITQIDETFTYYLTPEESYNQTTTTNISYEYDGKYPVKATRDGYGDDLSGTGTYYYEYVK